MVNLVKVKINEKEIWMETDEGIRAHDVPRDVAAFDTGEKIFDIAGKLTETIQAYCSLLVRSFQQGENTPDKISTEFGLKLSGEGNIYVVKTTGEASLKVTAEWNFENKDGGN